METIRYIDLCCGIGGFRVALEKYGKRRGQTFQCVLSADIKEDAIRTYNANFNETNEKTDLLELTEIPAFDLLCAGFPCQPFSSAGHKRGFEDERGTIIFKLIEICKKQQPNYIILENVSNLMTLDNGKPLERICSEFEKIGYIVSYKKLNAKDFGVPQHRERVFIVCCRTHQINLDEIKRRPPVVLGDVLENDSKFTTVKEPFASKIIDLHKVQPLYGLKMQDKRGGDNNIHSWDIGMNGIISAEEKQLMSDIMTQRRKKHWAEKKEIVWMDGMPLTYDEIKTFCNSDGLQAMLDHLVEKKYLRLEKPKNLVNGKREYVENGLLGYNICKGKLSFPISSILDPTGVTPTLTATDSDKLAVIIDNQHIRALTSNELKRICGFPDSFIIPDRVNKYDLFGNMVIPPVVEAILESMFGF